MIGLIDKIRLENFKAFKDAEIEIKPITILVGPNNGGKSSFIQSIISIQQTLMGSGKDVLSLNGPLLNLGDFESIVNQKAKVKEMSFRFEFDDGTYIDFTIAMEKDTKMFVKKFACNVGDFEYILDGMNIVNPYLPKKIELYSTIFEKYPFHFSSYFEPVFYGDTFFLKFRYIGDLVTIIRKYETERLFSWDNVPGMDSEKLLRLLRYDFYITWAENAKIRKSYDGKTIRISKVEGWYEHSAEIKIDEKKEKATLKASYWETYDLKVKKENGKLNIYRPRVKDAELKALSSRVVRYSYDLPRISSDFYEQKIKTEFNNINYIGPIREKAHRYYDYAIGSYDYVGSMGEHAVQMMAANPGLEEETQTYLQKLDLADALHISKEEKRRIVELELKTKIAEGVFLSELGCGTSQILPILVQSLYSKDESMTIIEQPEVHLHPKAEAELAELFIQIANKKKRFLIETHSDYFVERIRMGIMRGKEEEDGISNEDVAIYYMEQDEKKKCSIVAKIEINEMGQYSKLPEGYLTNIRFIEIKAQTDLTLEKLKEASVK